MNFGVLSTPALVTPLGEFHYTPLTKIQIYWVLPCLLSEISDVLTGKAKSVTYLHLLKT
jgi:hypothetical protein